MTDTSNRGTARGIDREKQRIAESLEKPVGEANALARKLGLEPYPVNYWIVDHDEMNALVAYGGFQQRYPHWRWGMQYERQQKQRQFLGGKAFEIVNNDNPAHAFLQQSNTLADQKAVITHVEAHADFFARNEWFATDPDAAAMLSRNAETIANYMADPEIDRTAVERWIDHVLCIQDNIDQHGSVEDGDAPETAEVEDPFASLDVSEEVRGAVFDDEWLDSLEETESKTFPPEPESDLLGFLARHGKQYDDETERATEMEEWQRVLLDVLRREAYYFAPQRMTKVMNEGWAAYWESLMMGEERFADDAEFLDYADHQAKVLNSPGFNPYKLGKELWEYVENRANRREVLERLLRVEGVTWRSFHDAVDFEAVHAALEPDPALDEIGSDALDRVADLPDELVDREALAAARAGEIDVDRHPWKVLTTAGLAARHYSLVKPQHRRFLERTAREELEHVARYLFEDERYPSVEAALEDVDREAGWKRMRSVRESHNDVTFIDEFLTQEFVDVHNYFTYEYSHVGGDYRATSTDYRDVKKKLLLRFTNLGKPSIAVYDANYENRNELLLGHQYNGVALDLDQAKQTLERVFQLWGRPVNLQTIVKKLSEQALEAAERRGREPTPEEQGIRVRYDGSDFETEEVPWAEVEHLAATDLDYDTRPEDWLA